MKPPIVILGNGTPWLRLGRIHLTAGQCGLITSPTGTGKTTVLRALAGLPGHDGRPTAVDGGIAVPLGTACPVAFVPQLPDVPLRSGCVGAAVEAALRGRSLPAGESRARAAAALREVGLEGAAGRMVESLSMGERHRFAIAFALATDPAVLLLDEPFALLDSDGVRTLRSIIRRRLAMGRILLVSEHRPERLTGLPAVHLRMPSPDGAEPPTPDEDTTTVGEGPRPQAAPPVLHAEGLRIPRSDGTPLLDRLALTVPAGRRVHLSGVNGAGKSTLLRCLIGAEPLEDGTVTVTELRNPSPRDLPGRVGFLPQDPPRHFFAETVRTEIGFALTRAGLRPPDRAERVDRAIAQFGLTSLADRSPQSLSASSWRWPVWWRDGPGCSCSTSR
ncbi:ATP-binding cassette domain-containing protein [Azospirillum agricola]|uniref:ATP-binding cassette domain-containing protein n=1 Tax=Azospirillum agricola TaxID=1720247 RepID=UPI000A0EF921|nr:ATP-binding cassette domain-containing protein [Azospirillum agricola]SMH62995.1 energy-coupling factor transport system ATP-binding protein [Azospirillum lipoferum]